jgi:hypothetical protein
MKGTLSSLVPSGIIIEPLDLSHLFFRMCREARYRSNESYLKELADMLQEGFAEEGYDLTITLKWGSSK